MKIMNLFKLLILGIVALAGVFAEAEIQPYFSRQAESGSGFIFGDERGPDTCIMQSTLDQKSGEVVIKIISQDRPVLSFGARLQLLDKAGQLSQLREGKIVARGQRGETATAFYNGKSELHIKFNNRHLNNVALTLKVNRDMIPVGEVKAVEYIDAAPFGDTVNQELRCQFGTSASN